METHLNAASYSFLFLNHVNCINRTLKKKKRKKNKTVEIENFTATFDYDAFDKDRVERLGYPIDWLRRCGLNAVNMSFLPDEKVIDVCEAIKAFDESAARCHIVFDDDGKKDQIVSLAKRFLEEPALR